MANPALLSFPKLELATPKFNLYFGVLKFAVNPAETSRLSDEKLKQKKKLKYEKSFTYCLE